MKPKPNALDLAAANISLTLVQIVIDTLIQKKMMDSSTMKEICDQMISRYSAPGPLDRQEIRAAAVAFARQLRQKYDVPPKGEQH